MINKLKYILGSLGFLVGLFALSSTASAATLSLSPASGTITAGQTLDVKIMLDAQGAAIDGVDVYSLHYNPGALQVQDANSSTAGVQITAGTLMGVTLINNVNTTSGLIQFSQVANGGTTFSSSGILATVKFKALANGTVPVTFDFSPGSTLDCNAAGSGVDKLTAVTNGSFTVTGATTNAPPPPSSGGGGGGGSSTPVYTPAPTPTTTPGGVYTPTNPPADGSLVKNSNSPAIYIIEYGKKREFASMAAFTGLGYTIAKVVTANVTAIPAGDPIFTATQRHPRGAVVVISGTVYFLGALLKYPFPSAPVFFSWGHNFGEVVNGNANDAAIANGPVVQMKP